MGNSYSIYRFTYHIFSDCTILLINHQKKIMQHYQRFYHRSPTGLVWLDRKGNPIPLLHMLDMHIEVIDPSELWNSIQT